MKKIKILSVVPSLSFADGITSYVMNYYRQLPEVEMDFIVTASTNKTGYYDEIIKNGNKVEFIISNKISAIRKTIKEINTFFENKGKKYDIIHCHVPNTGLFYLYFAKKHGIKIRIIHSHVNKSSDKILSKIRNDILSPMAVYYANEYFACSDIAGKFLFKNRDFYTINNAIDISKYLYSKEIREEYRNELNIKDKFVIGEFGRLCNQKNQLYTLEIFNEVLKIKKNAVLLFAGDGYLESKIVKKAQDMGILDKVIFLGVRKDLNKLYNCLDVFLLPSTYEGLGRVLIEAQANGLSSFTSKFVVPDTAKVTDLLHYISLEESPKDWANIILNNTKERQEQSLKIKENGFAIEIESKKLLTKYQHIMGKYGGVEKC